MRSLVATAALLVCAGGGVARADADTAACTFLEFSATSAAGSGAGPSIDADLKPLEKKLTHPPFGSWNTFKLLSKQDQTLAKQKPEHLALKAGTSTVILRDRTDKRVNLGLTVEGADGKRILDTKPDVTTGDWLVIGTSATASNDGHFLALTCH